MIDRAWEAAAEQTIRAMRPVARVKVRPRPASPEFIRASRNAGTRPELLAAMEREAAEWDEADESLEAIVARSIGRDAEAWERGE